MKKFIAVALILCSLLILCSCQSEPREVRTARIDENGELAEAALADLAAQYPEA